MHEYFWKIRHAEDPSSRFCENNPTVNLGIGSPLIWNIRCVFCRKSGCRITCGRILALKVDVVNTSTLHVDNLEEALKFLYA